MPLERVCKMSIDSCLSLSLIAHLYSSDMHHLEHYLILIHILMNFSFILYSQMHIYHLIGFIITLGLIGPFANVKIALSL